MPLLADHAALAVFLGWCTRATASPFALCADLRWYVYHVFHQTMCNRCGVVVETSRRVSMCFVRSEVMCFTCWHRARWPR